MMVCSLTGLALAQAPGKDMVYVTATVKDAKKAPVSGLKVENFQILEDGVEQKITAFDGADGAWDIDLIVAHSKLNPGRPDAISAGIRDAIDTFKAEANPKTHVIVRELKFGADGLFSNIDDSLLNLQKTPNPRRALVVITDGFDRPYSVGDSTNNRTGSTTGAVSDVSSQVAADPANKLVEYSRQLNIPIYFLYAALSDDLGKLNNTELAQKDALTTAADQTGGALITADPVHQLDTASKLLAQELRGKYVLGYVSTNDKKDNKWRNLKLKFTAPAGQKMDASIKKKYFVPKPPK
jgi:VWFA-related protein